MYYPADITCLQWGIRWNILTTCGGYTAREWLLQAFTVQQWGPSKLWGRSTLSACWGEAAKVAGMLAPQSANTKRGKGRGILFWYLLALIKTFKFDISSFAAQRPRAQWLIVKYSNRGLIRRGRQYSEVNTSNTGDAATPRTFRTPRYLCAECHTRQLLPLKCAATDLRVCLLLSFTFLLLFTLVLLCCVPLCVCVLISVCALSYHSHWIYPILFALVHLCVLCILMSTEFQHCLFRTDQCGFNTALFDRL